MRTDADYLPALQQRELERVTNLLLGEFGLAWLEAPSLSARPARFGSYARGDWVDEPQKGYQSDYDLLIIVSHEKLTDITDYWYVPEDKILRDPLVARPVNIIVHTMQEVNDAGQGALFLHRHRP